MKKRLFYSILFLIGLPAINAQTVSTYSGVSYSGGGQYDVARIAKEDRNYSRPYGLAIDNTANVIYVSHEHGIVLLQGIWAWNRSGNPGDPTNGSGHNDQTGIAARYDRPTGMALDADRKVVIADQNNSVIRHLDKFVNISNNAPVTTMAGVPSFLGGHKDAANKSAEFSSPADVAVNGSDVYVADRDNHCIRKISGGTTTTIAGDPTETGSKDATGSAARFYLPSGLFLESSTSLLVADYGNQSIRRINLTTKAVTTVVTGLKAPRDVYALNGKLYIADKTSIRLFSNGVLSVYAGSTTEDGDVAGVGTKARFTEVVSIDYHIAEKAFYVVDKGVNVIKKISTSNPPTADFTESTISASVGQTVILKDASTNTPTSWKWTITPANYTLLLGSTLTDEIVYLSFTQANSYTVGLKATNAEGSDEVSKNNHINVSTSASQVTTANFDVSNAAPETNEIVTLVDLSSYSPSAWEWTITPSANVTFEGGTTAASQFPKISFKDKGKYTVKLKATNANGNDTEEKMEFVIVDYPLSIKDNVKLNFIVYPNPVNEVLYTKGVIAFDKDSKIEIMDLNGKVLKTATNTDEIDLSDIPTGLYLVRITSNQKIGTKKIIKN